MLHIQFVEADIEKSLKIRNIGHHSGSRGESGISSTSSFIECSITRPSQPIRAKSLADKNENEISSNSVTGRAQVSTTKWNDKTWKSGTPKHEHDIVLIELEAFDAENACWCDPLEVKTQLARKNFLQY